ncbi:YrzI family small protein [Bacillus pinisoli]|nr:YrzI family small protein [Bacillus pinisoli]
MTLNILFFTITINRRIRSEKEVYREQNFEQITEQMHELKRTLRHFI